MKYTNVLLAVAAATMLMTGCAKQRGPANEALDKIEASLKDVRDDAQKYAPDGLKGVESQFESLKKSFEAKEYDNVLAGTPQLSKAVDSLKDAVASGKAHAKAALAAAKTEWEGLSVSVSKQVDTIQARIDELSKQKRLPFGISKDEFEGSKSAFESMKTQWNEAAAEFKKGDATEANAKARTAKGMGDQIADQLKIKQT
jgi:PBP1b-binding outer membrane lipoprotein LpoB